MSVSYAKLYPQDGAQSIAHELGIRGRAGAQVEESVGSNRQLSARQSRAVVLLAAGGTGRAVASTIGVHEQRISEWRRQPLFARALAEQLQMNSLEAKEALNGLRLRAIDRLSSALQSPNQMVGLRAALEILDRTADRTERVQNALPRLESRPGVNLAAEIGKVLGRRAAFGAEGIIDDPVLLLKG